MLSVHVKLVTNSISHQGFIKRVPPCGGGGACSRQQIREVRSALAAEQTIILDKYKEAKDVIRAERNSATAVKCLRDSWQTQSACVKV